MEHISRKIEDTEKLANGYLASLLKQNSEKAMVVGLYGNLGTGKTAFSKAVARVLGIKRKVNSPTFVIIKKYKIPKNSIYNKYKYFIHMDAYRLKNERELARLGWNEIISNKEHLVFIEWPEQIKKAMPKGHKKIYISYLKDGKRKFKIK